MIGFRLRHPTELDRKKSNSAEGRYVSLIATVPILPSRQVILSAFQIELHFARTAQDSLDT